VFMPGNPPSLVGSLKKSYRLSTSFVDTSPLSSGPLHMPVGSSLFFPPDSTCFLRVPLPSPKLFFICIAFRFLESAAEATSSPFKVIRPLYFLNGSFFLIEPKTTTSPLGMPGTVWSLSPLRFSLLVFFSPLVGPRQCRGCLPGTFPVRQSDAIPRSCLSLSLDSNLLSPPKKHRPNDCYRFPYFFFHARVGQLLFNEDEHNMCIVPYVPSSSSLFICFCF